jgi:hypothetical protein
VVKVHHDEDIASHIGPEPCAVTREGAGEASVGERTGQPLNCERNIIPGADDISACGRQHGEARHRERLVDPA